MTIAVDLGRKAIKQTKAMDSTFCFLLYNTLGMDNYILLDFTCSVKAAPHECVIRTGQP